jgi:hypothetical protein
MRSREKDEEEKPAEPAPRQETDYETLLAEGKTKEAFNTLKEEVSTGNIQQMAPVIRSASRMAKRIAREEIGAEDFDAYVDKAVEAAKKAGYTPDNWVEPEHWREAINYVMSSDLDKIRETERERGRREALEAAGYPSEMFSGGSEGSGGKSGVQLSRAEAEIAAAFGVSAEQYKKATTLIESHTNPDGSIEDVPILEDASSGGGGLTGASDIEPGKF